MTEDDWSLKGKRLYTYDDYVMEDGSDSFAGKSYKTQEDVENNKLTNTYCYLEETIETLRQKLIEDLEIYYVEHRNQYADYSILGSFKEIADIVNKRFGVK